MKAIILGVLIITTVRLCAQEEFTFKGKITDCPAKDNKVELFMYQGNKVVYIDSTIVKEGANWFSFEFEIKKEYPPGVYKLRINNRKRIDFVINKEDVDFITTYVYPVQNMKIIFSVENEVYYDFIKAKNEHKNRLNDLRGVVRHYNEGDPFLNLVKEEIVNKIKQYEQFKTELVMKNPETFSSKLISLETFQIPKKIKTETEILQYKKEHFWDNKNLNDEILLNSTQIPIMLGKYFTLYFDTSFSMEQYQNAYIEAIDILFDKCKDVTWFCKFVYSSLLAESQRFNYSKIKKHLLDNYAEIWDS